MDPYSKHPTPSFDFSLALEEYREAMHLIERALRTLEGVTGEKADIIQQAQVAVRRLTLRMADFERQIAEALAFIPALH